MNGFARQQTQLKLLLYWQLVHAVCDVSATVVELGGHRTADEQRRSAQLLVCHVGALVQQQNSSYYSQCTLCTEITKLFTTTFAASIHRESSHAPLVF